MAFHILCISGGGYRGLFAADILERLEKRAGRPIGECFDMISGTSIGGVIALGLSLGKTASEIRRQIEIDGPRIFPYRAAPLNKWTGYVRQILESGRPKYDGIALRETIESMVGAGTLLGQAKTRVLIPAVNVTAGKVQMFKTPHHPNLTEDHKHRASDIGMATAAAPLYFPLVKIGSSYYADGGLAANSPDVCAVHEAIHFAHQKQGELKVLSIGTTSSKFVIPASLGSELGSAAWLDKSRLVNVTFGVQQGLVQSMMEHDLSDRYLRIDEVPSGEHSVDLELDLATEGSTKTLKSLAEAAYRRVSNMPVLQEFLDHRPDVPEFVQRHKIGSGQ